jgi:uncharacterized protein DUF4129
MLFRMRGPRPALSLVVVAVLLLVVVVARGRSAVPGHIRDLPLERGLPPVTLTPGSDRTTTGLQYSANDPALFAKVILGIAGVLVLTALALSVLSWLRNRLRNRGGIGTVVDPLEGTIDTVLRLRLKEAVTEARDLLTRPGGEPRDAVIRAWARLENATDHRRAPHQTATEFTISLLERETADETALRDLRSLYHRARFGHHNSETDAQRARTALDRILATIR